MATWVKKFGGSSLATTDRIKHAANLVAKAVKNQHRVVVVVSAMQGETDRLLSLQQLMTNSGAERESAALIASGEQVSASLFAMALRDIGISARSFSGSQAGIHTTSNYLRAEIQSVDASVFAALPIHTVPVVTGYQGVNDGGEVTTLGRGGSDLSAVAIAHAVGADECQIYTDVDGVFEADPRILNDAGLIPQLCYSEMLSLASAGAKVLQMRAVEYGARFSVPLRIKSTFNEGEGTLVCPDRAYCGRNRVVGLGMDQRVALLHIRSIVNVDAVRLELQEELDQAGIDIDMLTQLPSANSCSSYDIKFTASLDDYECVDRIVRALALKHGFDFTATSQCAKISAVGLGLEYHVSLATELISLLSQEGMVFDLVQSSASRVSFVLPIIYLRQAASVLYRHCIRSKVAV